MDLAEVAKLDAIERRKLAAEDEMQQLSAWTPE
jgi:hypothetical protein